MNKELRAKTTDELIDLVIRLKGQLLQYRFKKSYGELDKPHLIKDTKRLLARIYTILTERKVDPRLVGSRINKISVQQNNPVQQKAKQAREEMQKIRNEKLAKSKKSREENKKKVAELKQQQKPIVKKEKVAKKKVSSKTKKTTKVKKTTNKMSSRTRRKGV
ncbi:50S ribosomal protein L29 [Mycoplasmoides alvi]|uniref:50S ribosomal protein L29 n=1 Tax=Mycoplasmoides alvi TaxID=78580 RepID=UPI00051C76FE|nr:50S ribosomal protein L29 [Mycoplasmoides alvi]